jgi:hypothetical protein
MRASAMRVWVSACTRPLYLYHHGEFQSTGDDLLDFEGTMLPGWRGAARLGRHAIGAAGGYLTGTTKPSRFR